MAPPSPNDMQHFSALKSQIIALATALYGTTTTSTTTVFDVLPFTHDASPSTHPDADSGATLRPGHGAALVYYTGPAAAPHTSWEMLSYVDAQTSVNGGAQQLLEDLQKGIGSVIGSLVSRYDWRVRHAEVPDFARGEPVDGGSEAGSEGLLMREMERSGPLGEERWSASLDGIEEVDEDSRR